jgi:D-apionolactonase
MAVSLVAGPLRLDYDSGDIRCVRLRGEEILRRIYVVFQDRNWTARPWHILSEDIDDRGDSFTVRVAARGTFDAEAFTWDLEIDGHTDGTVGYRLNGRAGAPFLRNRLGICVLHPMEGFAGRPCEIGHPDGSVTKASFPDAISPHQPFVDVVSMAYPVAGGTARLDFQGEVFETEDHRNWSDASYKTYCTPISRPFPVEVQPGDEVVQSVTLSLHGVAAPIPAPMDQGPVSISVSAAAVPLPSIGVHLTAPQWSIAEADDLRALALGHLHVDIDASDDAAAVTHISEAAARAEMLGARIFIALHGGDEPTAALAGPLAEAADTLAGLWVVHPQDKVTSRATTDAWRSRLGADLPWGGGTNLYFTELNRQPPDTSGLAWTTFSVNPQVHAHDDRSLMQNTATLEVIASDATRLAGDTRVHVGPITLRPRFNPNATDPASDVSSTDLPARIDARQRTHLGAAYAALALRGLAVAGTVSAVTMYDDLGWTGLRARDSGSEDPAFGSTASERFPAYDVLASLQGATHVLPTESSRPEEVDALVVEGPGLCRAILVNLTDEPREARLTGVAATAITLEPQAVITIDLPRRAS